jgi:hypothetical protein
MELFSWWSAIARTSRAVRGPGLLAGQQIGVASYYEIV